jgi:hypothetical protein
MSDKTAIYEAIPAILADVEAIGKNRNNSQQGYKFRGIDDVYNAIHPLLAKHKVFPTCEIVSRELTERQTKAGSVLFYVNIKAKYTLWAHDGSHVTTEAWGEAMDSGDKASNKAMSAAYKYALFQLLCIPTEAVDSEQDTHDVAPKRTDVVPGKPDQKSKAQKVADEHGLTPASELLKQKSAFEKAKAEIVKAIQNHDIDYLVKISGLVRQRVEEGLITKDEDACLVTELATAERKIEALKNQPDTAAA